MARYIPPDGTIWIAKPVENSFNERELQGFLGKGYSFITLNDNTILAVNPQAKNESRIFNSLASKFLYQNGIHDCSVFGNALLMSKTEAGINSKKENENEKIA